MAYAVHCKLTDSSKHSVPANMNPTIAKFLAYDLALCPMSLRVSLVVILWASCVIGESSPAMNRPRAPPSPNPTDECTCVHSSQCWLIEPFSVLADRTIQCVG